MPSPDNPKHETFAHARARGALLDDAFEDAGYAPNRGHPSRLAARQLALALTRERAHDRGKVLSFNEEADRQAERAAEKASPPPSSQRPPASQPASPDRPASVPASSGHLPTTFHKPAMTCQASPGAGRPPPRSFPGAGLNAAAALAPPSGKGALLGGATWPRMYLGRQVEARLRRFQPADRPSETARRGLAAA